MSIRILSSNEACREGLVEEILRLDRQNMLDIMDAAELEFPEEKRRKGLGESDHTIVVAFRKDELAGYVDYGRSWDDPRDVFIGSIQIRKDHRGGSVLGELLAHAARDLASRDFRRVVTTAQRTNTQAISLYVRLGFKQQERSEESVLLVAGREVLDSPTAKRLKARHMSSSESRGIDVGSSGEG